MTVAAIAGAVGVAAALVALWAWVMARIDERDERRHVDELRHTGSPASGGGPRHLRARARRW